MKYLLSIIVVILINSCANIVPLTGGKKDDKIPTLLKTNLTPTNFKSDHIKLEFDEYIATSDGMDLITIQPKHTTFSVNGNDKTIRIEFDSSLNSNTTYILNISSGIRDLNESNPFSLSYVFSTGDHIDTNFVSYTVKDYLSYKNLKIGLGTTNTDSIHKLKFDYLYPFNQDNIKIGGLGETKYFSWIFIDKNNDNLPDEYAPVYYDTIDINTTKYINMNNWIDARNNNTALYNNYTKIFKLKNDDKTYGLNNIIYIDKDSSLFYSLNNDTLPKLDLRKELSSKINNRLESIKTNKDYLLIIDKCGIRNIKITDPLKYKEDANYFYLTSKISIDSINFRVINSKDSITFYSNIKKYKPISNISTLKIEKNEKYNDAIMVLYNNDKIVFYKKISLKDDQLFYLNPGTYKIKFYNTDSFENISFNFSLLRRIKCKILETEIILKPNWDEVLQVIF